MSDLMRLSRRGIRLLAHNPGTSQATLECKTCGAQWVVTVGECESIASADLECTTDALHTKRRGKRSRGYQGGETRKPTPKKKQKKEGKDATADGEDGGSSDG
jgi:hypothetical protein